MISVLCLTYNEEANIQECLESVRWCQDIVVLDSFSEDRTVEIAKEMGARVLQRRFDDFAGQRNFGIEHGGFRFPWILHLDADERVTPQMMEEMYQRVQGTLWSAFYVPSRMMFQGKWLKYSGMYPSYQVRLGRRDRLRFKMVGHGQREDLPQQQVGYLREPLLHYSFSKGLPDWWEKHARYAAQEAKEGIAEALHPMDWRGVFAISDSVRRRRALKSLSRRLPCRPLFRFLYMFLLRRGFLDGKPGLTYCLMLSRYESMIVRKTQELRREYLKSSSTPLGSVRDSDRVDCTHPHS